VLSPAGTHHLDRAAAGSAGGQKRPPSVAHVRMDAPRSTLDQINRVAFAFVSISRRPLYSVCGARLTISIYLHSNGELPPEAGALTGCTLLTALKPLYEVLSRQAVVRPVQCDVRVCVGVWDTGEVDAVEVRSAGYRERCACVRCEVERRRAAGSENS
jgi:hypothetical protein